MTAPPSLATATRGYRVLKQWHWQQLFQTQEPLHHDQHSTHLPATPRQTSVVVNQVYPLRQDERYRKNALQPIVPEPTTYWLVHPILKKELSRLEANGFISTIQTWINDDSDRSQQWRHMQQKYATDRWALLNEQDKQFLMQQKWAKRFQETGIGGVRGWQKDGPTKLKCLHLHYAHYLAQRAEHYDVLKEWAGVESIEEVREQHHGSTEAVQPPPPDWNLAGKRVPEELWCKLW
jgi:hypothetical protein